MHETKSQVTAIGLYWQDAEMMHLKAIAIKEELLGAEDYEVGLSVGHLASLYNYHMNQHTAAEQLYLRSINISECCTSHSMLDRVQPL